jgi:hypothetical protein
MNNSRPVSICNSKTNISSWKHENVKTLLPAIGSKLIIDSSLNQGNRDEYITQSLDSGTYYILVRTNRNLSVSTNYNLTVSATYIVDDVLVSNPEVPLVDPEFDSLSSQAVWRADNGTLQVAPIDPETGFLLLDQVKVIDNGLPSLGKTENGPEWGYGNSLKIVYNQVGIHARYSVMPILL